MGDAPEERRFIKEPDDEEEKLQVALEVDTVFKDPVQRAALKSHPVLSSVSLLKHGRGTNFPLTDNHGKSLNELCPKAKSHRVSLTEAFTRFRKNPVDQMWVKLRRKRAEQLRAFLRNVEDIDLGTFNREVWQPHSATRLNGKDTARGVDALRTTTDLSPDG